MKSNIAFGDDKLKGELEKLKEIKEKRLYE
jgi:hypothetical protein